MKEVLESWQINQRVNLYLLNAIEEAYLQDAPVSKGRSVGEQFAHLHQVRLMWLKVAAPELLEGLQKIEKEQASDKKLLHDSLEASATAIYTLLAQALEKGKMKGFKPHPQAFLAYLLAHEAHHRGQMLLALKQSGHKIDQKVQYGLWEWGVR